MPAKVSADTLKAMRYLDGGATIREACILAGIQRSTLYRHLKSIKRATPTQERFLAELEKRKS